MEHSSLLLKGLFSDPQKILKVFPVFFFSFFFMLSGLQNWATCHIHCHMGMEVDKLEGEGRVEGMFMAR